MPGCFSQQTTSSSDLEEIWKWTPKRKLTLNVSHIALITVMMQYLPLAFHVLYLFILILQITDTLQMLKIFSKIVNCFYSIF